MDEKIIEVQGIKLTKKIIFLLECYQQKDSGTLNFELIDDLVNFLIDISDSIEEKEHANVLQHLRLLFDLKQEIACFSLFKTHDDERRRV